MFKIKIIIVMGRGRSQPEVCSGGWWCSCVVMIVVEVKIIIFFVLLLIDGLSIESGGTMCRADSRRPSGQATDATNRRGLI